jgi:hypothetical protein
VVVAVFVAQAQAEDALLEEFGEGVRAAVGVAVIGAATGERVEEVELGFDRAEEQAAGVGRDLAAIKAGADVAGAEVLEKPFGWGTRCPRQTAPV